MSEDMKPYSVTSRGRDLELREGDQLLGALRRGWFIHNRRGQVGGSEYKLLLAAPWTSMEYRLVENGSVLASAVRPNAPGSLQSARWYEVRLGEESLILDILDKRLLKMELKLSAEVCGRVEAPPEWSRPTANVEMPQRFPPAFAAFLAWLGFELQR